ncbi:MAG: prepilin-type N-terminal cleavage/methylation domain-containing protein [Patescibacteria group bacterium]
MKDKRRQPGFTLIEMIVSISIIVIITVLFIVNYHSTDKRTDLAMAAQNLVADLHLAQNNTLGLVKYNGDIGGVPPGGWGISLDTASTSYVMFADLDQPASPGHPSPGYLKYDQSSEGNVRYGARVTPLPPQIEIAELRTGTGVLNNRVNVSFLPPDPQTNIYRVDAASTSTVLEIKLQEKQNNTTKTVRVNFLGLIEVID